MGGRRRRVASLVTQHSALSLAAVAFAGIVFQLALTRLCSAALDYHLTFMVVSAAMLGTSAGGVWVAGWVAAEPDPQRDQRRAQRLCFGAAAAVALITAGFAWVPLRSLGAAGALVVVAIGFLLVMVPYACIGAIVALVLRATRERGRLYAADLFGAALACPLGLLAMQAAGPPWLAALAALALILAAACFGVLGLQDVGTGATILAACALAAAGAFGPNVLPTKPLAMYLDPSQHPDGELQWTQWDAVSRLDVFSAPGAALLWGADAPRGVRQPDLLGITIDGDALTATAPLDAGALVDLSQADSLPASLPYQVAPRARVLVIGPGGGVDVAAALHYGAREVDAVEVNPGMVRLMLGPLGDFSGRLYTRPGVHLIQAEGRSFLRRTPARYDAIVLTAVDSWAALTSGAYSLAESYLYTREAMADYYGHLSEGGTLAISRWFTRPPREMERLAALAAAELARQGQSPERAILVQRAGDFGTLLVRRGDFPSSEVARARTAAAANGFALAYDPAAPEGVFADIAHGRGDSVTALPTDDRPYFFDFDSWSSVLAAWAAGRPLPRGHAVLLLTLIEAVCMAAASIVLPLRRLRHTLSGGRGLVLTAYFALIGAGFMAVEMALVQRLAFLLGYPALALGATLGPLLLGAAAGSWLTALCREPRRPRWLWMAAALLVLYALGLTATLHVALAAPLLWRLVTAALIAAMAGVALGSALPLGLIGLPEGAVAWAWGINGAASALGATLSTMVAMQWGVNVVLWGAAGCYLAAGLLMVLPSAQRGAQLGVMR